MYLLDTNHCSAILNENPLVVEKLKKLGDTTLRTCVVVRGELMYMVHKSERKAENLISVNKLLNVMDVLPVDSESANKYGELKARLARKYHPEGKRRSKLKIDKVGISENDLWIAAVALAHDLTVVSDDRDFDRIREVTTINVESWISLSDN